MKQKLFIDFDGTLVNSRKALCKVYNHIYKDCNNFKYAEWTKNQSWNLQDVCTLANDNDINTMFGSKEFFLDLELFEDVEKVLFELSLYFEIYIVTIGTLGNLQNKAWWINYMMPYVKNVILLNNKDDVMDKSIIDMSGGIFIDDNIDNLDSSNASEKYVFGEVLNYNHGSVYERLGCWKEVELKLIHGKSKIYSEYKTKFIGKRICNGKK